MHIMGMFRVARTFRDVPLEITGGGKVKSFGAGILFKVLLACRKFFSPLHEYFLGTTACRIFFIANGPSVVQMKGSIS